jgi:hypothetical protein
VGVIYDERHNLARRSSVRKAVKLATSSPQYACNLADRAEEHCGARWPAVKAVVAAELERVADERSELAGRATEFRRKFFGK